MYVVFSVLSWVFSAGRNQLISSKWLRKSWSIKTRSDRPTGQKRKILWSGFSCQNVIFGIRKIRKEEDENLVKMENYSMA